MQGLYMISGIEDLTGNSLKDFYNNNKALVWGVGLTLAAIGINAAIKPKKKKRKK